MDKEDWDDSTRPLQLVLVRSSFRQSIAPHVLEDAGYYCVDNLPGTCCRVLNRAKSERVAVISTRAASPSASCPR
jgi:RNase adaptor protein for sRNA GlmZ degradation